MYDDDGLRAVLGDKLYKVTEVNAFSDTQEKVDNRSKDFLKEFVKNHTKTTSNVMFGPHYRVGQTLYVVDNTNNIARNYFVEQINVSTEGCSLTLAYYPG